MRRGGRRRAFLGGVALLAGLLAAEVALRVVGYGDDLDPAGPRGMYEADPELGVRLRPRFRGVHRTPEFRVRVETNSLGLREREIESGPSAAGRVLCLGDSFAFGYGVEAEEAYPRRTEERLRARGIQVEVVNAGVPSYGTFQQAAFLGRLAPRLRPAVAVASFFLGNDLDDNVASPMTVRYGFLVSPDFARFLEGSLGWRVAGRCRLALFGALAWLRWQGLRPGAPAAPAGNATATAPPRHTGLPAMRLAEDPEMERLWNAFEEQLAAFARRARDEGVGALLLYVPVVEEVSAGAREDALRTYGLGAREIDAAAPRRRVSTLAARHGVPLVDPTPLLAAERDPPYYPANKHWNARGHALAAEALAARLAEVESLGGPR